MAPKFQVEFSCVVMPCSVVVGYQLFGGPILYHNTWRHNPREIDMYHDERHVQILHIVDSHSRATGVFSTLQTNAAKDI